MPKAGATLTVATSWDGEIRTLYKNFYLVELILCQPNGLSNQALFRYQHLHRLLLETMEKFLGDLDGTEAKNTFRQGNSRDVLRKHAAIMRELNTAVDRLVMEFKPGQCS